MGALLSACGKDDADDSREDPSAQDVAAAAPAPAAADSAPGGGGVAYKDDPRCVFCCTRDPASTPCVCVRLPCFPCRERPRIRSQRYAQYFEMDKFMPRSALEAKMSLKGLDPKILDTPDAIACADWCRSEYELPHCYDRACAECSFCTDGLEPCATW